MSHLFDPLRLGGLDLANRILVSPMCQYSARDGVAQPWHWQHLGGLAVSGAAAVILEATAVEAEGRISPQDLGLWNDAQGEVLARLIADVRSFSSTPFGVQLAHAGRKAAVRRPWDQRGAPLGPDDGGWPIVGPSPLPFDARYQTPESLDQAGIDRITAAFVASAVRAQNAGFDLIELHGAHGYLLHEFFSPLSNRRTDGYGGSLENRMRFLLEVAEAVRAVWPKQKALGMRITGSDWLAGGVTADEAAALARELEALGLDYVCVSSGGAAPAAPIPGREPGYQVAFAEQVKAAVTTLKVAAVGMIVAPEQADRIIATGQADMVALARALLDDPRWPLHAAAALGATPPYPAQYERASPQLWAGYELKAGSAD